MALGTRAEIHGAGNLHAWPAMYGIDSWICDGNNVLDVFAATRLAVERCRRGEGPAVIVADTFRMGGHATHDEREAREAFPPELFTAWGRRDPIGLFESWLGERGIGSDVLAGIEAEVTEEMDRAADEALESKHMIPEPEQALYKGFSEGSTLGRTRKPADLSHSVEIRTKPAVESPPEPVQESPVQPLNRSTDESTLPVNKVRV